MFLVALQHHHHPATVDSTSHSLCSCGVSRGFGRGVGLVCMCGCVGGVGCYSPGVCASSWELRIDVSKSLVARGGDGSTRGRLAAVGRDFRVPVWTTFDCGASRRRGCGRCVLWRGWEREWRDGGRVQKARHETNLIKPISKLCVWACRDVGEEEGEEGCIFIHI